MALWQVDLLRHVQRYFGTCVNGKATLAGTEEDLPDEKQPDSMVIMMHRSFAVNWCEYSDVLMLTCRLHRPED